MAITNLEDALNGLTDEQVIPVPYVPPPPNLWDPSVSAIRQIIAYFKQGVESGRPKGQIIQSAVSLAQNTYNKALTRSMALEIWSAWQEEIAERS